MARDLDQQPAETPRPGADVQPDTEDTTDTPDTLQTAAAGAPFPPMTADHLRSKLEEGANRFGDGVAYGSHGTRGMYREGVKLMTTEVSEGHLSAADASKQLAEVGVKVSGKTLLNRSRTNPGETPPLTNSPWVPLHLEKEVYEEIAWLRSHGLVATMDDTILQMTLRVGGTEYEKKWTDFDQASYVGWYYNFLDRFDMSTTDLKPLETARGEWETSEHMFREYGVIAGLALRNGSADKNPDFDWSKPFSENKPYSEPIIWKKDRLAGLASMDETDVPTDQNKRCRPRAARSVVLFEAGERAGHSKSKRGRKPKHEQHARPPEGAVPRKEKKPQVNKAVASTKSAEKASFAGGSLGDGKSLAPLVMYNKNLTKEMLAHGPKGTAYVLNPDKPGSFMPQEAEFTVTSGGGMTEDAMIAYGDKILKPAWEAAGANFRRITMFDGLGHHCTYRVVKHFDE
eukprot:7390099-Prymnesium_polylepis.1